MGKTPARDPGEQREPHSDSVQGSFKRYKEPRASGQTGFPIRLALTCTDIPMRFLPRNYSRFPEREQSLSGSSRHRFLQTTPKPASAHQPYKTRQVMKRSRWNVAPLKPDLLWVEKQFCAASQALMPRSQFWF